MTTDIKQFKKQYLKCLQNPDEDNIKLLEWHFKELLEDLRA